MKKAWIAKKVTTNSNVIKEDEAKDTKEEKTNFVDRTQISLQGLIDKFFENQPSMKLISDGCECFVVKKDIYLENADDELLNAVANTVSKRNLQRFNRDNLSSSNTSKSLKM